MPIPTLDAIAAARARISGRLHVTPTVVSSLLASRCGVATLHLKVEAFQKTGSFKVRGALNTLAQLDAAAKERGVVTVSAGNHAQAVAWAARAEGTRATVVMPAAASKTKAAASADYGADVILHGTGAEAFAKARELADERGYTFVHPFEHPHVLAGAGTTGAELVEQAEFDVLVVPIGGGGLIGGVASAVKQLRPRTRIIGVEPTGADSMVRSLAAGHAVHLDGPPKTIADGLAAPMAGELCYDIVRQLVDEVVLVTDEEIAAAVPLLLSRTKILAEPAGAAGVAALLAGKVSGVAGKRVATIISGGNVDTSRLAEILRQND
ncbi:MAG TPA: threonine/serine dehydratase [Gemmatimonadaceae bacterium]|nr:threonine/serine dehydratase [Gemmatimonadaceae bacterium]